MKLLKIAAVCACAAAASFAAAQGSGTVNSGTVYGVAYYTGSTAVSSSAFNGVTCLSTTAAPSACTPLQMQTASNSLPSVEAYGTQAAWVAAQCASSPTCFLQFHTWSLVDRSFYPRPSTGGSTAYNYLTVPSINAQVGSFGSFNGDLAFSSYNALDGTGFVVNSNNTRRMTQGMYPFDFIYAQTFGNNTSYSTGNRDNTDVFNFVSTSAGGQIGSAINISSSNYSHGDNVVLNISAVGSGITSGDEEGDPELLRGYVGTNASRYSSTLTASPALDASTFFYDMPVASASLSNLGVGSFLLNATNTFSNVTINNIDTCTGTSYICITGSADGSGNFLSKYGSTPTIIQAITVPTAGQITLTTNATTSDTLIVNGVTIQFGTAVAIGSTINATMINLESYLSSSTNPALTTATYALLSNTISVSSTSTLTLKEGCVTGALPSCPFRFTFAGANTVRALSGTETSPVPMDTVIGVPSTSAFSTTAGCGVGSFAAISDSLEFQFVRIVAIPSPTTVEVQSWDTFGTGSVLSCGAAVGYGIEMNADDIPTGQIGTYLGRTGVSNSYLRPRFHPIVGMNSTGQLYVWSPLTNDYYTRALYKNTVATPPTITLTTSGGAVTQGTIAESGNEYLNRGTNGLNGLQSFLMPTPAVTFSSGCTATATVSYYEATNTWYVGVPSNAGGGTPAINIVNGGTGCTGATATLQSVYTNPATIYPMAIMPAFAFELSSGSTTSYVPNQTSLIATLVNAGDWQNGNSIANELVPHTKTKFTEGFTFYNTADGGGNQAGGSWTNLYFTGVLPSTSLWAIYNGDVTSLFAQPQLPTTATAGFKLAPNGLQVTGSFANTLMLSAPITPSQSQTNPTASLIAVDCKGYVACANMAPYALFSLPTTAGGSAPYANIAFNPSTSNLVFNSTTVTMPALNTKTLTTASNCSSTASPASCGSAAAGVVTVAASATSLEVFSTAATTLSEVFFTYTTAASGCGTSPTNLSSMQLPYVSNLAAGHFTMTLPTAPATNSICVQYHIIN